MKCIFSGEGEEASSRGWRWPQQHFRPTQSKWKKLNIYLIVFQCRNVESHNELQQNSITVFCNWCWSWIHSCDLKTGFFVFCFGRWTTCLSRLYFAGSPSPDRIAGKICFIYLFFFFFSTSPSGLSRVARVAVRASLFLPTYPVIIAAVPSVFWYLRLGARSQRLGAVIRPERGRPEVRHCGWRGGSI